jgi:hypothetical protein
MLATKERKNEKEDSIGFFCGRRQQRVKDRRAKSEEEEKRELRFI